MLGKYRQIWPSRFWKSTWMGTLPVTAVHWVALGVHFIQFSFLLHPRTKTRYRVHVLDIRSFLLPIAICSGLKLWSVQLSFCFFHYWFAIRTSKSTKVLSWLATEHIIELHHHATHEPGLFETTRAELILCWKTQSLLSAMNQGPRFQHEASYPQSSASCPRGRSSQMVSNIFIPHWKDVKKCSMHQEFRNLWDRHLGYQDDATFLNSFDTQPCFKR